MITVILPGIHAMRVAAAMDTNHHAVEAARGISRSVLASMDGASVTLAILFASPEHREQLEAVQAEVDRLVEPTVMIGGVVEGLAGPDHEVESQDGPAMSLWVADLDGEIRGFRSWSVRTSAGGMAVAGWPDTQPDDVVLLLADPYSYPAGQVVRRVSDERGTGAIVGGMVSGGRGVSRLLLDGAVHDDGAVGVVLRDVDVELVVSQGCRPVGEPLTVTEAEANAILGLGGRPALERLREVIRDADEQERDRLMRGLHVGLAIDEYRDEMSRGDFLIRAVLGVDEDRGAVLIGDVVDVGTTLQFQVRDREAADADLSEQLAAQGPASAALIFTCNGRGTHLFGTPDHDLTAVRAALGSGAVAGAFCAGEIGPVGGRAELHGFTASLAIFRDGSEADGSAELT